jgi:hypothetical protein
MNTTKKLVTALALATSAPALAGAFLSTPIPAATDVVRYDKGDALLTRETAMGTILLAPLPNHNGRPAFGVSFQNKGPTPVNFGLADISVTVDGKPVMVLTKQQLAQKAESAARWQSFGAAMLAGMGNTNSTTTHGYVGGTHVNMTTTYTDTRGQREDMERMGAAINANLSARLADASENIIDTTTVDPDKAYGGKIILDKPRAKKWPATVLVTVMGETFAFTMSK